MLHKTQYADVVCTISGIKVDEKSVVLKLDTSHPGGFAHLLNWVGELVVMNVHPAQGELKFNEMSDAESGDSTTAQLPFEETDGPTIEHVCVACGAPMSVDYSDPLGIQHRCERIDCSTNRGKDSMRCVDDKTVFQCVPDREGILRYVCSCGWVYTAERVYEPDDAVVDDDGDETQAGEAVESEPVTTDADTSTNTIIADNEADDETVDEDTDED